MVPALCPVMTPCVGFKKQAALKPYYEPKVTDRTFSKNQKTTLQFNQPAIYWEVHV